MSAVREHPIHQLPKFGDGIGLHRVAFLMKELNIDPATIAERSIVVTGSNGKGSTAKFCSELMRFDGQAVGLFTSPHLYQYNERFQLDGRPISDGALASASDEVLRAVRRCETSFEGRVGAFEAQFVTALHHFRAAGARWMVLEAGIGGRYDPVRLARSPVVGLVSLDLEHTDILGRTLLEIAFDKLDATPPGGVAVAGASCLPFEREIAAYAALKSISVEFVTPDSWRDRGVTDGVQHFDLRGRDGLALNGLTSRLAGEHQLNNHAVAVRLCRKRLDLAGLWPPTDLERQWSSRIAQVSWPGRLETISDDPPICVDVGHSPAGVRAALSTYLSGRRAKDAILVTGGSRDKNVAEMLDILAPEFDQIICTAAHHKGLNAASVADLARERSPKATILRCDTIEEAVSVAMGRAKELGRGIYVAGGLFLAAEFAEAVRGGNPRKMRFF